jgi:hypothetical protein
MDIRDEYSAKTVPGQRRKDVHEAIMFLAAAKSISTVMDSHEGEKSQHRANFFTDLDRWQSLFFKCDGSLYNFQHAVKEIWGITLSKNSGGIPLGRETLVHFQTLALNMMAEIATMLELEGSGDLEKGGLLFSQRRWRGNSHAQEAPSAYNDQAPGMRVSDDKRFSGPPDIYDYDP